MAKAVNQAMGSQQSVPNDIQNGRHRDMQAISKLPVSCDSAPWDAILEATDTVSEAMTLPISQWMRKKRNM